MSVVHDVVHLVVRQAIDNSTNPYSDQGDPGDSETAPQCETGNDYDGRLGIRISSIFVILIGSAFGAWFPVFARRFRGRLPLLSPCMFFAKYFGSGVIIATAFIHLLAPANEALGNPCLTGVISTYPWPEGIALMSVFLLFFVELMAMRFAKFGPGPDGHDHSHGLGHGHGQSHSHGSFELTNSPSKANVHGPSEGGREGPSHVPGEDHLGHARTHVDPDEEQPVWMQEKSFVPERYSAQMTAIFILEFGVIFHSIFIGLTLAVAGSEFNTLYVVLVFHQTFEGLGLGSRLASVEWPKSKRWTPYLLALAYGITTPLAIAIGLGVRQSYPPESHTTLITNGIFDSISAGILLYTGLVELMAHEFMFSNYMQTAPISKVLAAAGIMVLGAGLMALLGNWA